MQSDSNLGDILSGITLAVTGIITAYLVFRIVKTGKGFSSYISENPAEMFKSLSSISTVGESLSLAFISMNKGMDAFSAVFRFSLMGIIEIVTSFYFISFFVDSIEKKKYTVKTLVNANNSKSNMEDVDYLLWGDFIMILIFSCFVFMFSFFVTGIIHFSYVEAMDVVGTFQDGVSMFPVFDMSFEANRLLESDDEILDPKLPENWSLGVPPKRISGSVIVMIYTSTIFNILLILVVFFMKKTKLVFRIPASADGSDSVKEKDDNKSSSKKDNSGNKDFFNKKVDGKESLFSYTPFVESMFGVTENPYKQFVYEYIGMNLDTNTPMKTTITSNGGDPTINLTNLTKKLVTNNTHGLNKLYEVCEDFSKIMVVCRKYANEFTKATNDAAKESDKSKKDSFEISADEYKKNLGAEMKKAKGFATQFKSIHNNLANTFNSCGLTISKNSNPEILKEYENYEKMI